MKYALQITVLGLLVLGSSALIPNRDEGGTKPPGSQDWPMYGGNKAGNRYSTLTQINLKNVKNLKVAWTYNAAGADGKAGRPLEIQCQPIVINGILYGTTPMLKVFAVNAGTGEQRWLFDPFKDKSPRFNQSRGVMYWESGTDKRILYSAGSTLYALNALTGEPVAGFGKNGEVDLRLGLEDESKRDLSKLSVTSTTPGVIYKDILVLGSAVSEQGVSASEIAGDPAAGSEGSR